MPVNKISAGQNLYPPMTVPLAGGQTYLLPGGQGVVGTFGGQAGSTLTGYTLTGQYLVNLGPYCSLQMYDAQLQYWRNVPAANGTPIFISCDGTNYRVANTTGCPVGAIVTQGLGGIANGFNTVTLTPTAGGSTWNTIVGGGLPSGLISITTAGTYSIRPQVIFTPSASQGSTPYIIPTGVAVLSSNTITSVTVLSRGAGMVAPPSITVIPAPNDTIASLGGAVLTPPQSLTTGVLHAAWPTYYGTALTVAPTFTFTPASSISATAVMNFTATGISVVTTGASLGASSTCMVYVPSLPASIFGAAYSQGVNAYYDTLCIFPRPATMYGAVSVGAISHTLYQQGALSIIITDAGFGLQATTLGFTPAFIQMGAAGAAGSASGTFSSTLAFCTATVGATNDQIVIQPL